MFPAIRKRYTAYVVFQGAEHRRAWRIFTRRGWRHCWLVLPAFYPAPGLGAERYSVMINPGTDHVAIDVLFRSPKSIVDAALSEGATCAIKIAIDQKFTGAYVPRGLLTCVSLIKAALGLKAWYVWTPEHLARHLLRNGGEIITGETE